MENNNPENVTEDGQVDPAEEEAAETTEREETTASDESITSEETDEHDSSETVEGDQRAEVDLHAQISALEAELEEMKNRFLRAQADLENFRRRTRKEKEEQLKYASLPIIKALLPALDNLERALSAGAEASSTDGLVEGVEMVNRQILSILEQEGLQRIPAVGEPFNPEFHEAVMQVESDEFDSGIVVEELQKGYQLKDRVIRPAMVKVSQ